MDLFGRLRRALSRATNPAPPKVPHALAKLLAYPNLSPEEKERTNPFLLLPPHMQELLSFGRLPLTHARFAEAIIYYDDLEAACGPPSFSIMRITAYLDACLFAIASVVEFRRKADDSELSTNVSFVLALRNLTTHQTVLALFDQSHMGTRLPLQLNIHTTVHRDADSSRAEVLLARDLLADAFVSAGNNHPRAAKQYGRVAAWLKLQPDNTLALAPILRAALDELAEDIAFGNGWRTAAPAPGQARAEAPGPME